MTALARLFVGLVLLAGIAVLALIAFAYRPAIAAIPPDARPSFGQAEVQRGAALARIGNCASCHTAEHGQTFAGGVPIGTQFGTIYGTNITPDRKTGIGAWPLSAFARALRQGVARDGRQLYPAFPYDHFQELTDQDVRALYAYLMTRPPVRAVAPANRLAFPFGFRAGIALWKWLYLKPRPVPAERGAYLVEALAHCGACHTPHNRLGAEQRDRRLSGGTIEGWYAPPLDRSNPAVRAWSADRLFVYLKTGLSPSHAAAAGPMGAVARNLAGAPDDDVRAIATTIAAQMGAAPAAVHEPALPDREAAAIAQHPLGAAIFQGSCAACHGAGARMMTEGRPPLPLGTPLHEASPRDTIRIILDGLQPPLGAKGPYMPAFADALTDRQVAEIVAYLRTRYGDAAPWPNLPGAVARARNEARP